MTFATQTDKISSHAVLKILKKLSTDIKVNGIIARKIKEEALHIKKTAGDRYCVYTITCIPTGRIYAGATKNFQKRIVWHKSDLACGISKPKQMLEDYKNHGKGAFVYEVESYHENKDSAYKREACLIAANYLLGKSYNSMRPGALKKHSAQPIIQHEAVENA